MGRTNDAIDNELLNLKKYIEANAPQCQVIISCPTCRFDHAKAKIMYSTYARITFLCIFVQGRCQLMQSQLIQIYSVDWTDVYDTHNIEHRTEPVSHYSISGQLILPQR